MRELLNHTPDSESLVLDPRILSSYCFKNKIKKSDLKPILYSEWASNSMEEY